MSPEIPIQIDLSNDNSWDQVDDSLLTPEDKSLLKEQFNEDTEGIIYLTQQELAELKDIISLENSITDNPRGATDSAYTGGESLSEFILQQKSEGLSSSDLFQGVEGAPEQLEGLGDTFDDISYEALFGEAGVMNGIDLSDVAKDNMSVALTLSIVQQLNNIEGISLVNFTQKTTELVSSLNIITQLAQQTETTDEGPIPYKSILDVSNQGEGNYMFMDVSEGMKLFDGIFSGEINEASLEKYIEDRNLPEGSATEITHRMTALQTLSREQFSTLGESFGFIPSQESTSEEVMDTAVAAPIAEEFNELSEEEKLSLIERLKKGNFMDQILAAILEVLQNAGLYDGEEEETTTETPVEQPDGVIPEDIIETSDQIQGLQVPGFELTTLLSTPEGITSIKDTLENLDAETSAQQEFEALFGAEGNFTEIATTFQANNEPLMNGISDADKFIIILNTYSTYRKDPEVASRENNRTLWDTWSKSHDWTQN